MRVLILEDDLWIADLLKQILPGLRPGARVDCHLSDGNARREPILMRLASIEPQTANSQGKNTCAAGATNE